MVAALDICKGDRFNRWVVIKKVANNSNGSRQYLCKCDCGNEGVVVASKLKSGHSKSCGCYCVEQTKKANTTHGMTRKHPLYRVWNLMQQRCYDKHSDSYKYYGKRGISVCKLWKGEDGFSNFYNWATNGLPVNQRWRRGLELDRKDTDGDYTADNCHFITRLDNVRNRRDTIWVNVPTFLSDEDYNHLKRHEGQYGNKCFRFKGRREQMVLRDLCDVVSPAVSYGALVHRIQVRRWDIEEAMLTPPLTRR